MTLFIFVGDMLVMAFMVGVAIWFGASGNSESALAAARIPLEDEDRGVAVSVSSARSPAASASQTRGDRHDG
tara:strand:- start:1018 stop:1233 length:216 start_codon:yes stop_codon:yes gene_type:complete